MWLRPGRLDISYPGARRCRRGLPKLAAGDTAAGGCRNQPPAAATGKQHLLLWDGYQEESSVFDALVAKFNQANPDIEVKREAQPQMRDILRTALDAGQGPDIMNYDTGPGFAGVLARAGLLLPLDDGYAQYG